MYHARRSAEPLLEVDSHAVTRLLADRLADAGLDRQLVGSVAERHEGAGERVTIDGPLHLHQPPRPEERHRLRPHQIRPAPLAGALAELGGEPLVQVCHGLPPSTGTTNPGWCSRQGMPRTMVLRGSRSVVPRCG